MPGHAAYAAIMGYYLGQARFERGGKRRLLLLQGLVYAIVAHGLFDFGLMSRTGWGLICTGATFLAAVICAVLAIRESSKASGMFWAARQPVAAEEHG